MSKFNMIMEKITFDDILAKYGLDKNYHDFICCPIHQEQTPSCKIYPETKSFHCFGCDASGDLIKFVALVEQVDNNRAANIICNWFNLDTKNADDYKPRQIIQQQHEREYKENPILIKFVKSCIKNINQTNYFQKRGLNNETIKRFMLGYDIKHKSVVIPYNRRCSYYQARSTIEKKFYKPKSDFAGAEPLFNEQALKLKQPVFVVESPICAMSIAQCGGTAIALCGVQGWKKVIQEHKDTPSHLILCLDNDEVGKLTTLQFTKKLDELKISYQITNIADDCKDPNELLMQNPQKLKENIQKCLTNV